MAHLAGALAAPVWTLLHAESDWRWLLGRSDSPWYPTMHLFRQTRPGAWEDVWDDVLAALSRLEPCDGGTRLGADRSEPASEALTGLLGHPIGD